MNFPALIARELRARSRHWDTYRNRTVAALVAVGIVTVLLVIGEVCDSMRTIGGAMFTTLAWLGFGFCLFEGLRNTVDCLSGEKRDGTLGLLFLTELTSFDVVAGKMAVNALAAFYSLLAAFPALAMPFIVGGVTAGEFWRMLLALINALFFSLTAGLMISALGRDERTVWSAALALMGLVIVGLPVVDLALAGGDPAKLSPLFGLASPWGAFTASADAAYTVSPGYYWSALGTTHLLAWLCLVMAGICLKRSWREPECVAPGRLERLVTFQSRRPRPSRRVELDQQARSRHPLLWLAEQGGQPVFLYLMVLGAGALSVALWLLDDTKSIATVGIIAVIFWVVHGCLRIWTAAQASNAITALRESGMLELILVAPVTGFGIASSLVTALRRKYYRPVGLLVVVEIWMLGLICTFDKTGEKIFTIPVWGVMAGILLLDLNALTYTGLWYGLSLSKASAAVTRTVLYALVLPYAVIIMLPFAFCGLGVPIFFIAKSVIFSNTMRDRLYHRFAQAASQAFVPESEAPWWWPWGRRAKTAAAPPPLMLPTTTPTPPSLAPLLTPPLPLTGPPCVSCGKPMGGLVSRCPYCGWTQPG